MRNPASLPALLAAAALVASCAPKATPVSGATEDGSKPAPAQKAVPADEASLAEIPAGPDDIGLRLPDMLGLPGENELRTVSAPRKPAEGAGAVTARPPTEPPSRPKTPPAE